MSTAVLEAPATSDESGAFTLEVYSKPSCVQCGATHRKAGKLKIAYVDARLHEDVELNQVAVRELGSSLGISAAPLLIVRDSEGAIADAWGGFNPDKMDEWAPVLPTVQEAAQAA